MRANESSWGMLFDMSGAVMHEPAAREVQGIVEQFVAARRNATFLSEYPGAVPADLETAYRCQELAIERWPDRIGGWKVARIGPAWRNRYTEERLIGPVFESNVYFARAGEVIDCPVFEGGLGAVEAELVIRVGADAPADKLEWTIEEAVELIGRLHIGVEIAGSPLPTLNELGPGAVIADFGNNRGVVVGGVIGNWREVEQVAALTFIDDEVVGRGTASIRQGAAGALAFALEKCARRGRPLRAGAVISTGMITGVHDIRIGQQSRHVFASYGDVRCRAVRSDPFPEHELQKDAE